MQEECSSEAHDYKISQGSMSPHQTHEWPSTFDAHIAMSE